MLSCPHCEGEGFIDLGVDARTCTNCNGTGKIPGNRMSLLGQWLGRVLTEAEREMILQALGQLTRARPINRRLGREATPREVIALAHKLGLHFARSRRVEGVAS